MAEQEEKTEDPTPQQQTRFRQRGQVATSQDVYKAVTLILALLLFMISGSRLRMDIESMLRNIFSRAGTFRVDINNISQLNVLTLVPFFKIVLPIFAVLLVGILIAWAAQTNFLVSWEAMQKGVDQINPVSGFKKLFSLKSLVTVVKSLSILAVLIVVVYLTIKPEMPLILSLIGQAPTETMSVLGEVCFNVVRNASVPLFIIAILDYAYQKYSMHEQMKMSKQEVKDDMKNTEGDPQVKSKVLKTMKEAVANAKMVSRVPDATVVVTNPTHFAVALLYEHGRMRAPRVIAKGADLLAQRMRRKAQEDGVPIVEKKQLARALYASVKVGMEIPEELYQAVAEVLAYIYQLKRRFVS